MNQINFCLSTRYVTHLSVSGNSSQLDNSSALSLQSSISSYRRSSHARSQSRFSAGLRSDTSQNFFPQNQERSFK